MISINYTPTSIEDFKAACEIVAQLGLTESVATTPVIRNEKSELVLRYCALRGLRKYYRSDNGRNQGLSPDDDIRLRAKEGDLMAIKALQEESEESEEISFDFPDTPDRPAPEGGRVY